MLEEGTWRKHPQSETLRGGEVTNIVRHDDLCLAGYGYLDDHVVVWVGQQGPPKEEDLLPHSNSAHLIDQILDVARPLPKRQVTKQGRLVLGDERNRNRHLEQLAP